MECELCGRDVDRLYLVEIDGLEYKVCSHCRKFGRLVKSSNKSSDELDFDTEDYGEKIRELRESLNLSVEEFAKRINEKPGLIRRVEKGVSAAPEKLVKKIERTFHIKLT